MIFYYLYFNHGLKFQDYACNGCHDLSLDINNIAIILLKIFIIPVLIKTLANPEQFVY